MSDILQAIHEMVAWYRSEEYAERERAQARRETAGYLLVEKAREQGIITDTEAFYLSSSVAMNGGLIVSPTMAERLKQVNP